MTIKFYYQGFACEYFTRKGGEILCFDGQCAPFKMWTLDLRRAAYRAAGIHEHAATE